jgi:hypothetical protein
MSNLSHPHQPPKYPNHSKIKSAIFPKNPQQKKLLTFFTFFDFEAILLENSNNSKSSNRSNYTYVRPESLSKLETIHIQSPKNQKNSNKVKIPLRRKSICEGKLSKKTQNKIARIGNVNLKIRAAEYIQKNSIKIQCKFSFKKSRFHERICQRSQKENNSNVIQEQNIQKEGSFFE